MTMSTYKDSYVVAVERRNVKNDRNNLFPFIQSKMYQKSFAKPLYFSFFFINAVVQFMCQISFSSFAPHRKSVFGQETCCKKLNSYVLMM